MLTHHEPATVASAALERPRLYTSSASGCASLVTRHGTTLHLAHAIAADVASTAVTRTMIAQRLRQATASAATLVLDRLYAALQLVDIAVKGRRHEDSGAAFGSA